MNDQKDEKDSTFLLNSLLHNHFGHSTFRPLQLEAIQGTLSGQDVLVILPTGGGKSLTFQLTPLLTNKITIVITPLLALAKDQIDNANDLYDIEAVGYSSQTSPSQKASILAELASSDPSSPPSIRLLYTTPESLQNPKDPAFIEALTQAHSQGRLASLAIDEAHCVSQWGHDFRPSYATIGSHVRPLFPGLPVIAVTATAAPHVRTSIIDRLCMNQQSLQVLVGSFNRPEIQFNVEIKELLPGYIENGTDVYRPVVDAITQFIHTSASTSRCGIVYCKYRRTCEYVASALQDADIEAAHYHAGLDIDKRKRVQQQWKEGDISVVVATIAFGMGIDKADCRYVIHCDPPSSLEGLYQEAGRAGRDGRPAISIVYSSHADLKKAQSMEGGKGGGGATAAVAQYVLGAGCRRMVLLRHFGEKRESDTKQRNGCRVENGEQLCDYCHSPQKVCRNAAAVEEKIEEWLRLKEKEQQNEEEEELKTATAKKKAVSLRPLLENSHKDNGEENMNHDASPARLVATEENALPSSCTDNNDNAVNNKRRRAFFPPRRLQPNN